MAARGESLGEDRVARVAGASVRYWERGEGPPVVFVHGLLVNSDLWRGVVPAVADAGYRCVAPDWPLGAHELAVPDADLTPPGLAMMIAGFLEELDLHDATIVANDTGGALTQILMALHPERVGRVILTPCDSFERFFPPVFAFLPWLARVPGAVTALAQVLRLRILHRLPFTFGWVSKRPIPRQYVDAYLGPSRRDPAIRRDLARFLRTVHRRHTLSAAEALPAFEKPVLLAWAEEDRLFPVSLARRLADVLPNARLVLVADSYTFIPEDQPALLADLIIEELRR